MPMPEEISSKQFHAARGVGDWVVVNDGARARFRTGSFAAGVELVEAIGRIADEAGHHPDVDLRYGHVDVRTLTHDLPGLSQRDIDLARDVSAAARNLDAVGEPGTVQNIQLTIDTSSIAATSPFWQAILAYEPFGDEDVVDPFTSAPRVHFQRMDEPRRQRNRIHVDLYLPQDQAETRVAAAVRAGGSIVDDSHAPAWWTLADPEGNEVDIAPWPDAH